METNTLASQPPYMSSVSVTETACPSTPSGNHERELLGRVARQDLQAFDTLYAACAPRVQGYLARGPCPSDLIDEVLQDVMLVLWQRAARVPPDVPLVAWLCGVARHKTRHALARISAPPVSQESPDHLDHDEPEAVMLRQERGHVLKGALATLPPCERRALELRLYQSCSHREIAALTGHPVSTVRTQVARARQRLRARIDALDSDGSSPS